MTPPSVKITRIDPELPLPEYQTAGSVGADLYARCETTIEAHSLARIPSNLIIECPSHLALMILPRSSLFARHKLLFPHSIGLVDQDFCGPDDEILIQVYNFSAEKITIPRGERLAQAVFVPVEKVQWNEQMSPQNKSSRGGFGST